VSLEGMKCAPSGSGKASRCRPKNVIRDPPAVMPLTGDIPVTRGSLSGAVETAV